MKKYRKRPVEIEAVQFDGRNQTQISDWMLDYGTSVRAFKDHLDIPTLEGTMRADIGDWVAKGIDAEFYPIKPLIFARTYDEVVTGACTAALNIKGEHFSCELAAPHPGLGHSNAAAEALWADSVVDGRAAS